MTNLILHDPDLGKIVIPQRSYSFDGAPTKQRDVVHVWKTKLWRPKWAIEGLGAQLGIVDLIQPPPNYEEYIRNLVTPFILKGDLPPDILDKELVWHDISWNERVDKGSDINITRLFGAASGASTAAGVLTALAIASASLTPAHADLSLGSGSANVTTNEFTTIGLSRAAATVQNYVPTTTLDATVSVDLFKSFSVSGTGTAYGGGVFDSTTVSGSFLFVEKNFATSSASVINGDTLQVTATITL